MAPESGRPAQSKTPDEPCIRRDSPESPALNKEVLLASKGIRTHGSVTISSVSYDLDGAMNRTALAGGLYPGSPTRTGADALLNQYSSVPDGTPLPQSRTHDARGQLTAIAGRRNETAGPAKTIGAARDEPYVPRGCRPKATATARGVVTLGSRAKLTREPPGTAGGRAGPAAR